MEDTRLLILGTRMLAIEIADVASDIPGIVVDGFVENMDRDLCSERLEGLPVYWIDDVQNMSSSHKGVCALGTTRRSLFTNQAEALGLTFTTLIHPTARISLKSTIGEGTIVSPGVIIASHNHIGRHVLINRGALIGHHNEIGEYVTIQPGVNMAGCCRIGNSTFIGMGAIVMDHIKIGSNSVVGAGAVVTKDVPDNVQVMGIPARIVKEGIEGK